MLGHAVLEIREAQVPLLSAMLLGGCAAKLARILRVGSMDAGLGPTALFPLRLRRPVAITTCAVEFACGVALIVTAGGLGRGGPATAVRLATSLLFLVATCALIELRTSHPETGCGCFGEFSRAPVSGRTLARSAFFAAAALGTIGLPPLRAPHPGADAARLLGIFAIELVVIALLSPELGEALTRLGYSEPCELRRLPTVRTLAALRRSSQWRKRSWLITTEVPVDMVRGVPRPDRRPGHRDHLRGLPASAPAGDQQRPGRLGNGRGAGMARGTGPAQAALRGEAAVGRSRLGGHRWRKRRRWI